MIVVIPCYDEPQLIRTLSSLHNCIQPACNVEVITVINASQKENGEIKKRNIGCYHEALQWAQINAKPFMQFHFIIQHELPHKHAGVGLARKIGMDEAVRRFEKTGKDGIIVCFDADATCDANYLDEIEKHFTLNSKSPGCSIYFEHPLSGSEFENDVYDAILDYELFLRYYKQSLQYAGFPFAFHTIGSSMAVRSSAYCKQGGMNRRKAGEDFYFLQKIIALGNFSEINTTRVIPSPRPSHRVPFGTGKAVADILNGLKPSSETYSFRIFEELKCFVENVNTWYAQKKWTPGSGLSDAFNEFMLKEGVEEKWDEMLLHSASRKGFDARWMEWMDAFFVLKLVHHLRDAAWPNQPLTDMCNLLLKATGEKEINDKKELLKRFRERDIKK